jgi:hypothetical protein
MMQCEGCEDYETFFQSEYKFKKPMTDGQMKDFINSLKSLRKGV